MQELLESHLKERHWKKYEAGEITLHYTPYYVFNFDAFPESGGGGKLAVSESESGTGALNGVTGELSGEVAEFAEENEAIFVKSPGEGISFVVEKLSYNENEILRIAPLRLAAKLGIGKDEVIVSGLELVYLPEWIVGVKLAGEEYELSVSAVTGEIVSGEEIPLREKGWSEVTKETLSDLKSPKGWVSHSKNLAHSAKSALTHEKTKSGFSYFLESRSLQAILLVILAALILAQAFGFIKLP